MVTTQHNKSADLSNTIIIDTNISNIDYIETMSNMSDNFIIDTMNTTEFEDFCTISIDQSILKDVYDYSDFYIYTDNTATISTKKEFDDYMPDLFKIKEMCQLYPGFKKAFDNFYTMYNMVKEEYEIQKKANK
jgi:hypothetical protein